MNSFHLYKDIASHSRTPPLHIVSTNCVIFSSGNKVHINMYLISEFSRSTSVIIVTK